MAKLTRQEIKVLQLIAEGKSTKEISNQLAITFHTVEGYRKSILFKTGSKNMCEAVALGFKNKLLLVIVACFSVSFDKCGPGFIFSLSDCYEPLTCLVIM